MEEEKEEWRAVVEYEGLYEVSSFGRIKSLSRLIHTGGCGYYKRDEQIIKLSKRAGEKYLAVGLHKDCISKTRRIHQIVAMAFLNYTPSRMVVVHHIDEDKLNNYLSNLEIKTQRYNASVGSRHRGSSSVFVGVYLNKKLGKFKAGIVVSNRKYHLGYFVSELEAGRIYETAVHTVNNGTFNEWLSSIRTNKNKTSKFIGVHFCSTTRRWKAAICTNGVSKRLGSFKDEYSAHAAYKKEKLLNKSKQSINIV